MNVRMGEQQVLWYGHCHQWQQKGMMLTTMWYIMVGLLNLIICQLHYLVEPEGYCMVIGITFILFEIPTVVSLWDYAINAISIGMVCGSKVR